MTSCMQLVTCSICLEIYDEPVTLICLHSFCKKCIDDYSKEKESITCPLCQTSTQVECIKSDYRIKEFVTLLEPLKCENLNPFLNCDICDEDLIPTEVHLCKECGVVLCMKCRLNHERGKRTKTHVVYALSSKPIPYCRDHNEKLKYYCDEPQCKKVLCVSCALLFHDGHNKLTIEAQAEEVMNNITRNMDLINKRIDNLRLYSNYLRQHQLDIEEKLENAVMHACKRRDFIIEQAHEAYRREASAIYHKKAEMIKKLSDSIDQLETLAKTMSPLLKYTEKFLKEKSYHDINEINTEVLNVLKNDCKINFQKVNLEKLKLISATFNETRIKEAIVSYIGKVNVEIEESNILLEKKSTFFYEKIMRPRLISSNLPSREGLSDILYDKEHDEVYSLNKDNNNECLVKTSKNGSNRKFVIKNCFYGYRRNYLAILPDCSILVLVYSDGVSPDRIITVDKTLESSKTFQIGFCNAKDVFSICSSPCRNFVIFLCENLFTVFRYSIKNNSCIKAILPKEFRKCNLSYISLSENTDHIAFGCFKKMIVFSFKAEAVVRSFGASESFYTGVSFLTETVLIAGLKDCSLNIFDVSTGKLLKKIRQIENIKGSQCKIESTVDLISTGNDSILIFNQKRAIHTLALK